MCAKSIQMASESEETWTCGAAVIYRTASAVALPRNWVVLQHCHVVPVTLFRIHLEATAGFETTRRQEDELS